MDAPPRRDRDRDSSQAQTQDLGTEHRPHGESASCISASTPDGIESGGLEVQRTRTGAPQLEVRGALRRSAVRYCGEVRRAAVVTRYSPNSRAGGTERFTADLNGVAPLEGWAVEWSDRGRALAHEVASVVAKSNTTTKLRARSNGSRLRERHNCRWDTRRVCPRSGTL